MSTDIATAKDVSSIQAVLKNPMVMNRLESILKDRAPQFSSSLISLVNESNALKKCNPNSIMASAMVAATLDLPIQKNLGFAHIVPYNGVAQFQMGAKGFIQLALRTGQYSKMNAEGINADAFAGYDEVGEPIMDWSKFDPTQPIVGFVFAFKLVTGFTKTVYWSRERCLAHAKKYSQAYRYGLQNPAKASSPWFDLEDAMCLKTVVKAGLSKWGILSVELQKALSEDQSSRGNIDDAPSYIDTDASDVAFDDELPDISLDSGKAVDKIESDGGPMAAPRKSKKEESL